mgnify:FL=1
MDTFDINTAPLVHMNNDLNQLRQNVLILLYAVIVFAVLFFLVSLVVIYFVFKTHEKTDNLLQYHKMSDENEVV